MATSDSTTYFFTGNNPISFRAMQTSFVNGNTNVVRMQDYIRITDGDTQPANMVVPDATENASVNTSTGDMKLSDYRGSIKEKKFTQTGDEEQYDIDLTAYSGVSWNSNLSKNVFKQMIINGRCYSDANSKSANSAAARYTASDTKNFEIFVLSSANQTDRGIYGASGAGGSGGTGGNDGEGGGVALWVDNASNRANTGAISVRLESNNSRIYGGGGGGGQGGQGNSGGSINCHVDGPRESGNNNNAFPSLAGTLVVANPNSANNKYIVSPWNQNNVNNKTYHGHAFAGGSDNVGRACARSAGQCDSNWSWQDANEGWVTGSIRSNHSGTGLGMVNCREWGYNANFEMQNHPNQSDGSTSQRGRCRGRSGERGASYGNASSCTAEWTRICQYRHNFTLTPNVGGNGGAGGRGEGVGNPTNNLNKTNGSSGGSGQTVTCNTNGNNSSSNAGGNGGNGGNWGEAGNDGNGSSPGNGGHEGWGICRTNNSQVVSINGSGNATNCVLGGSGHQNQTQ